MYFTSPYTSMYAFSCAINEKLYACIALAPFSGHMTVAPGMRQFTCFIAAIGTCVQVPHTHTHILSIGVIK